MSCRIGIIGSEIRLGARFMDNGALFTPYSVGVVKIYTAKTGGLLLATLTPVEVSEGFYQATWDIPTSVPPSILWDKWTWQAIESLPTKTQTFSFEVQINGPIVPEPPETVIVSGCHAHPDWVHYHGLKTVTDLGNGMSLQLEWEDAIPSDDTQNLYYNVYYSRNRFGVFAAGAKAITSDASAIITVTPGDAYYSAIRATQFDPDIDIEQLTQIGINLYEYPDSQVLNNDLDAYGVTVEVENTEGYPSDGYILVGYEIMGYNSLDATNFYVDELGRGEYNTEITEHYIGESVQLWKGFEDGNTNIVQAVADWYYINGTPRNVDAIGQPNVDDDGYRAALEDDITTDLVASETSIEDFSTYDFAGYHRNSLQETFAGDSCLGSYLGGEFNGTRGFNMQDRILSQLESLIQLTGEPVVILRRKWSGKRCQCISLKREHQRVRCPECFGTGFDGGYDRLFNSRAISESFVNTGGMFMLRFAPYVDDVDLVQDQGLRQTQQGPTAWGLTIPNLRDRDVVIRFTQDGVVEFAYFVLSATRNKLFYNQAGRLDIRLLRADKTDAIYEYPTDDSSRFVII